MGTGPFVRVRPSLSEDMAHSCLCGASGPGTGTVRPPVMRSPHVRHPDGEHQLDERSIPIGDPESSLRAPAVARTARPTRSHPEVEIVAFAEDSVLSGRIRLAGERVSDLLNDVDEFSVTDALVEDLVDGHAIAIRELLLMRDEVFVVDAAGPRGNAARRRRTCQHPVIAKAGPYEVFGYVPYPARERPDREPSRPQVHGRADGRRDRLHRGIRTAPATGERRHAQPGSRRPGSPRRRTT